jgi:hypothetical protein
VELTKVSDFDMLTQASLEFINEGHATNGDGAVVDMDHNDCDFILCLVRLVENGLVD